MPHALSYIFRRAGSHVFLCAANEGARYETACGHCGYPILLDQAHCPRCRRELETCPCCNTLRHVRSLRHDPDPETEVRTCPICGVRRAPFGSQRHTELTGTFCTNIFSCPVGGLLLATGELALLPQGTSLCPLCRHESLRPLPVRLFGGLIESCIFCRECFSATDSSKPGSAPSTGVSDGAITRQAPADGCPLCARKDYRTNNSTVIIVPRFDAAQAEVLTTENYSGVLSLGRTLIEQASDEEAARILFSPPYPSEEELSQWIEWLLVGTHAPAIRKILERRTRHLLDEFRREFGVDRPRRESASKKAHLS
jgi:hypothetical protein